MSYTCRTLLAVLLVLATGRICSAQHDSEDNQLNRPSVQHGVTLEISSRVTALNETAANFSGLRLNWAMRIAQRHQSFIGVSGYVLTTPLHQGRASWTECRTPTVCQVRHDDVYLVGGYGGIDLRYSYRLNALFEVGGGATIGPGYAALSGALDNDEYGSTHSEGAFVVVEPGVELAYRPTRFFALTLGGSYRYAPGFDLSQSSRFSGYTVGLGLQFGWL